MGMPGLQRGLAPAGRSGRCDLGSSVLADLRAPVAAASAVELNNPIITADAETMAFMSRTRTGASRPTKTDYERAWGRKVGNEAAGALYATRYTRTPIRLVPGTAVIGAALASMGSGEAVAGWSLLGITVCILALCLRAHFVLSQALTRWFGVRIWDVPRRPGQFDAWVAARCLEQPDVGAAEATSTAAKSATG
jgi:hypothetical protein